MRSFILTTTAALATTAVSASTVTLKTAPCSPSSASSAAANKNLLTISLDTASPVAQNLEHICHLSVLSASASVDLDAVTCHLYRDTSGNSPLSGVLSLGQSIVLASDDTVKTASLLCKTTPLSNTAAAAAAAAAVVDAVVPRRDSGNATSATHLMTASGNPTPNATALVSLQTAGASASASAGMPSHGRNGTTLSGTGTPTPTSSEAQASETGGESAAVRMGARWGMGVLAAGLAVLML